MIFLVPAALAGLGAVAAPVAIHLLNKRKIRVVHWGATRFLLETVQKNQRRFRLEQWLLLALRCLLLALLALAFARPVLHPGGMGNDAAGGPTVAVLLLDQSASMGQSNGVQTRFDQARDAARKVIEALRPGSQAALFLVANRVNPVVPRPTANLPLVRHTLELAAQTDRGSDFEAAIKLALDTLRPIPGAGKEIDLFTDNQASAWQNLDAIRAALAASPEVRLRIIPSGERGEDNLAVTTLRPETAVPAAGQSFGCLVEVSNFSAAAATGVRVTLSVDDGPSVDETMLDRIEPGQARTARLNVRLPKSGFYVLNAAIPADRFPADDRRAQAVHVVERADMAIVEGGTATSTQDRDAFFLANALAPVSPSRRADYYLKVDAVQPPWLQTAELARNRIIFLSDVAAPGPAASQRLLQYVRDGGSLVIFPGARVQPDVYNNDPAWRELLPARLGARIDLGREGRSVSWQAGGYHHPVTALWNDPQNGNLGTVRVTRYFPLTLPAAADGPLATRAVINYADGTPAVVERACGKGRVVLFGIPATTRGSNLPIHPDFVPLLRRLIDYLSPDPDAGALVVRPGGVFQKNVKSELAGREVSVVRPGGVTRPAGKVELAGQEAVVRYRDTEQAGGYRLQVAGEDGAVAAFAVQIDPSESDLKVIDPAKLATLTGAPKTATGLTPAPPEGRASGVRREFWMFLVCCAGLVALGEIVLANKLSVSR